MQYYAEKNTFIPLKTWSELEDKGGYKCQKSNLVNCFWSGFLLHHKLMDLKYAKAQML